MQPLRLAFEVGDQHKAFSTFPTHTISPLKIQHKLLLFLLGKTTYRGLYLFHNGVKKTPAWNV